VEEVVPTAVRCTEGDPDACVRLADAYEKGTVVATNAREAKRYRRIALTLYVSQCQRRSALACHRLADAYRDGDGVVPNEASTVALRQRVQELCAYRRNQAFCEELAAR
jgi:TPR repeat protein